MLRLSGYGWRCYCSARTLIHTLCYFLRFVCNRQLVVALLHARNIRFKIAALRNFRHTAGRAQRNTLFLALDINRRNHEKKWQFFLFYTNLNRRRRKKELGPLLVFAAGNKHNVLLFTVGFYMEGKTVYYSPWPTTSMYIYIYMYGYTCAFRRAVFAVICFLARFGIYRRLNENSHSLPQAFFTQVCCSPSPSILDL